jgi:hypothetical protein
MFMIVMAQLMFSAGISKLVNSKFRWLDGHTLAYCLTPRRNSIISRILIENLRNYRSLAILCSVITVGFELLFPVGIFCPWLRFPLFCVAILFHLLVYFTMTPNYVPQSLCYLIVWDWQKFFEFLTGNDEHSSQFVNLDTLSDIPLSYTVFANVFSFLCMLLVLVSALRIEYYPYITCAPMYSVYRGKDYHPNYLQDEAQLKEVVRDVVQHGIVNCSHNWFFIWLRNSLEVNETQISEVPTNDSARVVMISHVTTAPLLCWESITKKQAIEHIILQSEDNLESPTRILPGIRFLRKLRVVLQDRSLGKIPFCAPDWSEDHGLLELGCRFRTRRVVLASVRWKISEGHNKF